MHTAVPETLRQHARPQSPRPTGCEPVLARLPDIRAVLFDIYGTLFVSGAGSIGATSRTFTGTAFSAALDSVGLAYHGPGDAGVERFTGIVRDLHAAARQSGCEYPEVDVLDVWHRTLAALMEDGLLAQTDVSREQLTRLAVEFEGRTNPVWPMPHVLDCCRALHAQGILLGVISNAQFYTPALFPAFFDKTLEELGFDPELQFYSYRFSAAKPGLSMHLAARETLARRGIAPGATVYVGNDLHKDVITAARVGFRTALFAGDQRSLRLTPCPDHADIVPDLVLTDLAQLPPCVLAERRGCRSCVPEAFFDHPENVAINRQVDGRLRRLAEVTRKIRELAKTSFSYSVLRRKLRALLDNVTG